MNRNLIGCISYSVCFLLWVLSAIIHPDNKIKIMFMGCAIMYIILAYKFFRDYKYN